MFVILVLLVVTVTLAQNCEKRDYGNAGHVCVCNSSYCDIVPEIEPLVRPQILIYSSNKAGLRFLQSKSSFNETNKIYDNAIHVDTNVKYQKIIGWGGAFTDATGINIKSLAPKAQENLLKSYFGKTGIEYSLCRVPIGGTDFSSRGYSYDDGDVDFNLTNFKLVPEDFDLKIPFITAAKKLTEGRLKLFASAWTAPKWMKANGKYAGWMGFLKNESYQSWADYHLKFLQAYDTQYGISFWGITTGNEPSLELLPFNKINSVAWTPELMSKWIKTNLGPTLRKSKYSNIKIMILDDQRFFLPWYVQRILNDNSTINYVDGIAVHWYHDFNPLFPPNLLKKTHDAFPTKFLLATEASYGDKFYQKKVDLGSWYRGERYADDIIDDLLNWVEGWTDWNMALNLEGGPTYIKNFVDAPIIVNATSGEFYKQPMYYNLGHFSKFVPPDSVRISTTSFDTNVKVVGFLRPDNGVALIILNKKDEQVPIAIVDNSIGAAEVNLSARSITTILYW